MMKRILKERVEELLAKRGIQTLTELHLRIQDFYPGFAWKTLSQSINDRSSPTLGTLDVIARGLDTTVAYLIGEVDDPAPVLGAGEPLPEVRAWSNQLRAMPDDRRQQALRVIEGVLAMGGLSAAPNPPDRG